MALDEKTFQSAIAKINKVKARSASVAQVLVFEDPPHMRKQNDEEHVLNNPILEQADRKEITTPEVEKIAPQAYEIQANNKGTNKGTEHGTKWGTEITPRTNVVQKEGTNSNTQIATKKGTQKGFNTHKSTNNKISSDMDFLYRRPYDALTGIPKKIVDVIFEICRKYSMQETPPVPFATLVRLCKEKKNSVKVARQRLLEEGIISTKNSRDTPARGRSGMLIYKLRDDLFQEIDDSLS